MGQWMTRMKEILRAQWHNHPHICCKEQEVPWIPRSLAWEGPYGTPGRMNFFLRHVPEFSGSPSSKFSCKPWKTSMVSPGNVLYQ